MLSTAMVYLNQLAEAKTIFYEGLAYFEKQNQLDIVASHLLSWSDAQSAIGEYEAAYKSLQRYNELITKIMDTERESRILRLKAIFQSSEKDREIRRLSEVNQRNAIELENQQLKQKLWWLSGGLLLASIVLLLILYRKAKARNLLLFEKNLYLDNERFHDPLTGCFNRRYFDKKVLPYIHKNTNKSLAIFALDIDHFKQINDTYGHNAGDEVLKEFSQRIIDSVRDTDRMIRMGGEEFLLVAETQNDENTKALAKKILTSISSNPIPTEQGDLECRVSIGCLHIPIQESGIKNTPALLELIDNALYKAKESGRNRAIHLQWLKGVTDVNSLEQAVSDGLVRVDCIVGEG